MPDDNTQTNTVAEADADIGVNVDAGLHTLEAAFFGAFERGDADAIARCYAPEMRVWNNLDRVERSGAEHIAGLQSFFFPRYSQRTFTDVITNSFRGGFVRQHVFSGIVDGMSVSIPMCLVCRVRDGKLLRIDEYLNFDAPAAT